MEIERQIGLLQFDVIKINLASERELPISRCCLMAFLWLARRQILGVISSRHKLSPEGKMISNFLDLLDGSEGLIMIAVS